MSMEQETANLNVEYMAVTEISYATCARRLCAITVLTTRLDALNSQILRFRMELDVL